MVGLCVFWAFWGSDLDLDEKEAGPWAVGRAPYVSIISGFDSFMLKYIIKIIKLH